MSRNLSLIGSLFLLIGSAAFAQTPDLAVATPGTQALTQVGKVWSCSGNYWNPQDVSIGNRGTQVFAGLFHNLPGGPPAMLLSSFDSDPATPCWLSSQSSETTFDSASAAFTDTHVAVAYEGTSIGSEQIRRVNKFSSRGLDWAYTYPQLGAGRYVVGISRDGDVIVAAMGNPTTGLNDVLVFGPDSAVPVNTFTVPTGTIWGFDLSAQGTHAVFAIETRFYVLDLADGSVHLVYDHSPGAVSSMGLAISGDGSVVGCETSDGMALYEWDGSDYVQTWLRNGSWGVVADISDDSSTLVYGAGGGYGSPWIITECVDIPSKTVTMSESVTGTGQYGNFVEDIAVSASGDRFATATWGDEFDLVPEVRVYSKYESAPIRTLNLPGSAVTVDISPDGRWVAAGSRPMHAQLPGLGGRVDLIRMDPADFAMTTVPAIGNTVTFEVFGRPGRNAYLLESPNMVEPALAFPGWGLLHLDMAGLTLTPMGVIGPAARRTIDRTLSADPLLIGTSRYFQGFTNNPKRRLTRDWVVMTLLP